MFTFFSMFAFFSMSDSDYVLSASHTRSAFRFTIISCHNHGVRCFPRNTHEHYNSDVAVPVAALWMRFASRVLAMSYCLECQLSNCPDC